MGLWLNASKPESRLEGTTQPRRTLSGWTSIAARPPAPDGEQRPLTSTAPGAGRRPKRAPRPSGRPRHLLICPWKPGARSPADDLILGTGLVRSRAAPRCDLLRVSPVSKICSSLPSVLFSPSLPPLPSLPLSPPPPPPPPTIKRGYGRCPFGGRHQPHAVLSPMRSSGARP